MYNIMPAKEEHHNFIISTYLKSRAAEDKIEFNKEEYYQTQKLMFYSILKDPNTKVLVAADDEDPIQIYGWVVYGKDRIFWGYVKLKFRKEFGIWKELIKEVNDKCEYVFKSKYLFKNNYIFNPKLLRDYVK